MVPQHPRPRHTDGEFLPRPVGNVAVFLTIPEGLGLSLFARAPPDQVVGIGAGGAIIAGGFES
jgi:hypothetical protein